MPTPWRVIDGNYSNLLEVACDFRFPFSDKGDFSSFEAIYTYRIAKDSYYRFASMSTKFIPQLATYPHFGTCYLVEHGDPKDAGDGTYEFNLTYASIPSTREEGQSINFTYQWWRSQTAPVNKYFYSVNYDIEEHQFVVDGTVKFEYFTYRPPPLFKYGVYLLFETLQYKGGASGSPGSGSIIAEDSKVSIYKGGIFCRETPYVFIQ